MVICLDLRFLLRTAKFGKFPLLVYSPSGEVLDISYVEHFTCDRKAGSISWLSRNSRASHHFKELNALVGGRTSSTWYSMSVAQSRMPSSQSATGALHGDWISMYTVFNPKTDSLPEQQQQWVRHSTDRELV